MKLWFKTKIRNFGLWLLSWSDFCPTCGASWLSHTCPETVLNSSRVCGVCDRPLPVSTLRTHEGKWRCRSHKTLSKVSI